MKRRWFFLLTLLAATAIVLTACPGGGGAAKGPIKVGAVFDFTGPTSDVGTPYGQGVIGYVEWLNGKGGINGRKIDLHYQDYAYKVPQAEQLYSQFVQEGVVAFMGWGTGDTEALRKRIADDKIPFMSASYSHILGNPKEAPYNFLVGTSYSDQFFIVMDWIKEDWQAKGNSGAPKVAFMHHPSPFGLSPWEQGGKDYAKKLGIEAKAFEMPKGVTDFVPQLSQIRDFGAKYIVFQTVSSPAALALKNAQSLGMNGVTFICLNWCADENLIHLAGPAAEGTIGAFPFTPPSMNVPGMKDARDYLAKKGSSLDKQGIHYIQGWWTMATMAEGIRKTIAAGKAVKGINIKASLEGLKNFDTGGVTVPITFTATDHHGSKGLRLFKVKNGKWVQMSDYRYVKQ